MDCFVKAKLIDYKTIELNTSINDKKIDDFIFTLVENNIDKPLKIISKNVNGDSFVFFLEMDDDFIFGYEYCIKSNMFDSINLNVTNAVNFIDFDEKFAYDGDDLGAIYFKDKTIFSLWAPLASKVVLKIEDNLDYKFHEMNRDDRGVYRLTLKGDYVNKNYHYIVKNSGITRETNDPYGKAVNLNSEYSTVVDLNELNDISLSAPKNTIENYVDSIIYETNVRDFTEHKSSNIEQKGKFLGFVEEGKKTFGNNPCGIDYLKFLGITHVQLQPVLDFYGVDDSNVLNTYNWGYDVTSFFALEGSYSNNPSNPISRLKEFKAMIALLHKNNIRVILDVVYNHVYKYENSTLEKSVPNYFFRKDKNGKIANASGCGNDVDSERYMARKIIVDSVKYLTKTFDVDGFRFDLMGLIDIETINTCVSECTKIKKDMMFYGEGWDMGEELASSKKAKISNHSKLKNVAFFNDMYRDIFLGSIHKNNLNQKGFANGNFDYLYGFDFIFHGSCLNHSYEPMFDDANKSINYFECHDNSTYFDKLSFSNSDEYLDDILKRIKFANKALLLSFGVPFIHSGQEIGQSKRKLNNTYNITRVNRLDFDLLDQRFELALYVKYLIQLRKSLKYLKLHNPNDIEKVFKVEKWDNNLLCFKSNFHGCFENDVLIIFNNETRNKVINFDSYYKLKQTLYNKNEIYVKNNLIPNCSIAILEKEVKV